MISSSLFILPPFDVSLVTSNYLNPSRDYKYTGMRMVAIAVTGNGGAGKTTLVANLGVYFAWRGYRTLLIDGDLYLPKLSMQFGILNPKRSIHSLLSKDSGLIPHDVVYRDSRTGVDIIPGSQNIYSIRGITQSKLDSIAEEIRRDYDITLIDTPVGVPFEVISTFSLASRQVVIIEPGRNPRKSAKELLMNEALKFKSLGDQFGIETSLIFNKVENDMAGLISSFLVDLDGLVPVIGSVRYDRTVGYALLEGVPSLALNPQSGAAEDIYLSAQFLEVWLREPGKRKWKIPDTESLGTGTLSDQRPSSVLKP